jgi:hypothetical protein
MLDRPGPSLRDLITMLDDLKKRGVKFRSLRRGNRHRDADRPRHVADDWRAGGTGTQPYQRTDTRRSEGRETPRREIWAQAETDPKANRPRPEVDRARRILTEYCGRVQGEPHHPLPGACLLNGLPDGIRPHYRF